MNSGQRSALVAQVEEHRESVPVVTGDLMIPLHRGYFVYLFWNQDGQCIYVGRVGTKRAPAYLVARLGAHPQKAPWWPEVERISYQEFSSFPAAWAVEVALIEERRPVHNAQHRMCRAGLHDITLPESRWADGRCKACALKRSAEYRESHEPPSHEQLVKWRKNHRLNIGEEEHLRRVSEATGRYRSKQQQETS